MTVLQLGSLLQEWQMPLIYEVLFLHVVKQSASFLSENCTNGTPSSAATMRRSSFSTTSCPLTPWITSASPMSSQQSVGAPPMPNNCRISRGLILIQKCFLSLSLGSDPLPRAGCSQQEAGRLHVHSQPLGVCVWGACWDWSAAGPQKYAGDHFWGWCRSQQDSVYRLYTGLSSGVLSYFWSFSSRFTTACDVMRRHSRSHRRGVAESKIKIAERFLNQPYISIVLYCDLLLWYCDLTYSLYV